MPMDWNFGAARHIVWDVDTLEWVKGQQSVIELGNVTIPGTVTVQGSVTATGPLTDAQLRAADVKMTLDGESVPVTGAFYPTTQPISATNLPLPAGAATDASITALAAVYIQRIDYTGSVLTYIGHAVPGTATAAASWKIKKLVYSGTDLIGILYADGNTNFDNVWDDRASLSYS